MSSLAYRERPAQHDAAGLLILHHGRGTDERDLLALGDQLDPGRRFHLVTPRAPLKLAGSPGRHWYVVPRVGYPDYDTFHAAYDQLAAFHDALWSRSGIPPSQTVLGGFSMGAVMSYALGLAVEYHESDADHRIHPQHIPFALKWLERSVDRAAALPRSEAG